MNMLVALAALIASLLAFQQSSPPAGEFVFETAPFASALRRPSRRQATGWSPRGLAERGKVRPTSASGYVMNEHWSL
jgi:hypothetical protein